MIGKIQSFLSKIGVFLSAILLFLMFILIFTEVFFRYVLQHPLGWTNELSTYCLIWCTFFASTVLYRKGTLVKIDFFTKMLPPILQNILELISNSIVFVFAVIFLSQSFYLIQKQAMWPLVTIPFLSRSIGTIGSSIAVIIMMFDSVVKMSVGVKELISPLK